MIFHSHKSCSFRVRRGVLQGSLVGPVLFPFSSRIFVHLCILPSAALFMLDLHLANLQTNLLIQLPLRFNPTAIFLGIIFDCTLSYSRDLSSLKGLTQSIFVLMEPPKKYLFFCLTHFFGRFSLIFYPDGFLFLALANKSNWNAFTERLVAPSPATSRLPLYLFSSLRCHYLSYESDRFISLCRLMSGLFVSQLRFPFHVWPKL